MSAAVCCVSSAVGIPRNCLSVPKQSMLCMNAAQLCASMHSIFRPRGVRCEFARLDPRFVLCKHAR